MGGCILLEVLIYVVKDLVHHICGVIDKKKRKKKKEKSSVGNLLNGGSTSLKVLKVSSTV